MLRSCLLSGLLGLRQVTLYQLLLEERYGVAVERGLLWYLNEAGPDVVKRSSFEVTLQMTHVPAVPLP